MALEKQGGAADRLTGRPGMLVVTRRRNERVRLRLKDGPVLGWIEMRQVCDRQARIGMLFPQDVVIEREELLPDAERLSAVGRPDEL